jgi:GT2 family glycosyltransferase
MEHRGERGTEHPDVSVIMVNWNCADVLLDCLRCLENGALEGLSHEILVVDNASTDGSVDALRRSAPGVRLLLNRRNVGFGAANNRAMRLARGRYFLLLNPDTLPGAGAVSRMVQVLEGRSSVGLAGCHLVDRDGKTQECVWYEYAGHPFPVTPERPDQDPDVVEAGWISGACMLVRKEVFAATGGFDPALFLYGEDPEWCYRIWQAGWRVVYLPGITIVHLGGASSSRADEPKLSHHFTRGQWFFRRKHVSPLRVLVAQTRTVLRAWRGVIWYGALARIRPNERWRVKYRRDRERLAVLCSWNMWWPLAGWGRRTRGQARPTLPQPPERGVGGARE